MASPMLWDPIGRAVEVRRITSPSDEIDVAELYVPFSCYEPMRLDSLGFAPEGEGWNLNRRWKLDRRARPRWVVEFPSIHPAGSSNPISASGMIRFAESAIQAAVKGGHHQVEVARKALSHAYGVGAQ